MKLIIYLGFHDVRGVLSVPDDFDLEKDKREHFAKLKSEGKLRFSKNGGLYLADHKKLAFLHAKTMDDRFESVNWEYYN